MRRAALGSVFRVQRVCSRHITQTAGRQFIFGSSSDEREPTTYEIAMRTVNRQQKGLQPWDSEKKREAAYETARTTRAREKSEALEARDVGQNPGMLTKAQFELQQTKSHGEPFVAQWMRRLIAPLCSAYGSTLIPWPPGSWPQGTLVFYSAIAGYFAVPFVFRRTGLFGVIDIFAPKYGFPWDPMTYAEYSAEYKARSQERGKKSEQDGSSSWYDRIRMLLFGLISRWTLGGLVASAIKTVAVRLAAVPGLKAVSGLLVMFAGACAV
jgi:hypothetical protein